MAAPAGVVAHGLYKYNNGSGAWEKFSPSPNPTKCILQRFNVLSWNMDSARPIPNDRAKEVINHIKSMTGNKVPHIVFFQDLHAVAINAIIGHQHVKDNYTVTQPTNHPWGDKNSGTFGMVHKDMPEPINHFRIALPNTTQKLDGLFFDFKKQNGSIFRIGTTELERGKNLCVNLRKNQLAKLCEFLPPKATDNCTSGLLIGETYEGTALPDGIRDAYTAMGGIDGDSKGSTWGMHAFPPVKGQRRQRALGAGISFANLARIGGKLKASNQPVSDSVGLMAHLAM